MHTEDFYSESTDQSRAKIRIVTEYFACWAAIMQANARKQGKLRDAKMQYVDLFAGQGLYEDGTKSTPVRVMEMMIADPYLREHLVSFFNDEDSLKIQTLEAAFANLPGFNNLRYPPQFFTEMVSNELIDNLNSSRGVPTFTFVDPWGYKGMSLDLLWSAFRGWGCDCLFFFNYNRVNPALSHPAGSINQHMKALFQEEGYKRLQKQLKGLGPSEREKAILAKLVKRLRNIGGDFVVPFKFKDSRGARTSHYLIGVTKDFLGFEKMKEIMAKHSSRHDQGVPSYEFDPIAEIQLSLGEMTTKRSDLAQELCKVFSGREVSLEQIYREQGREGLYLRKNYRAAVQELLDTGKIELVTLRKTKPNNVPCLKYADVVRFPTRS